MALLDRLLHGKIRQGRLTIVSPDGNSTHYGTATAGWPSITLRLNSARASRRIMLNPRLGMGEAYMDGDVSVDGDDIMGLVELIRRNNPWEKGGEIGDPKPLKRIFNQLARSSRQLNNLAASRSNVAHHYDLSNDFYRLWLDEDMQYSCAYWSEADDTLERAQLAKRRILRPSLRCSLGKGCLISAVVGVGWHYT
jgi:cyclopropane-fatty-acyl-phospholipid synthase